MTGCNLNKQAQAFEVSSQLMRKTFVAEGNLPADATNNQGFIDIPMTTPNFRIYGFRVSVAYGSQSLPWGIEFLADADFLDENDNTVINETLEGSGSSVFAPVMEKLFYNYENMIVTGAKKLRIDWKLHAVSGATVPNATHLFIKYELFYMPLRY